jgi:phage-related minor tail protein
MIATFTEQVDALRRQDTADDAAVNDLHGQIAEQRTDNRRSIEAGAGFGARTTAMWHLVRSDFRGFGFFHLGVAALLVCLDCAAVWLLVSHRNAYERTEARAARRLELSATKRHEQELRVAGAARDVAGDGLDTMVAERRRVLLFRHQAVEQATARLMAELEDQSLPSSSRSS